MENNNTEGQHFIQAAYIGFIYGLNDNKNNNHRKNLVPIIDLNKVNDKTSKFHLNNLNKVKAENLFISKYLDKNIEKTLNINNIEKNFMSLINMNKSNLNIFSEKNIDLTSSYFALHEARNILTYNRFSRIIKNIFHTSITANKTENNFVNSIDYLFQNFDFFKFCNVYNLKNILIKDLIKVYSTRNIDESILKKNFNNLYPLYWYNRELNYKNRHWLEIKVSSENHFLIGSSVLIDFEKIFNNFYATNQIKEYIYLSKYFKNILKKLVIFYLG